MEFSRDEKNRDILEGTFTNKGNGEFISMRLLSPGRLLIFKKGKRNFYLARNQLLDHVPLNRSQTRILVRHYYTKKNLQRFVPFGEKIWDWKSWKIFTQDHDILRGQTEQSLRYGRHLNQYLLVEDQLVAAY